MSLSIRKSKKVLELSKARSLPEFIAMVKKDLDLTKFETFGNNLTVAIYIGSNEWAPGILKTDDAVQEDEYQGNVGLVVKVGAGLEVEEDDWKDKWVRFGYTDGTKWRYNDVPLRDISVDRIRGTVEDPNKVL